MKKLVYCPYCFTRLPKNKGRLTPIEPSHEPAPEPKPIDLGNSSRQIERPNEHKDGPAPSIAPVTHPRTQKRVDGPHLKQEDCEREILELLSELTEPNTAREIIQKLQSRLKERFSKADLEPTEGTTGRSNLPRWQATARFAMYQGLKKKGLIAAASKNQWAITPKGRELVSTWS